MAQPNSLTGKIEVGDTVETLDAKRTIVGLVTHIDKRGKISVVGTEYDGGPEARWRTTAENLALVKKGGQGEQPHRGHRRD